MTLRLADKWIWDFWTVQDGTDHHVFYLQAPRTLGDPELRHWNVSIGHAVSTDLESWDVLPDALAPGPPGSWDDFTTWTGSVCRHGDAWAMLYTGTCRKDQGLVQRIGLATSPDLTEWTKHPANPVLEADSSRYELLNLRIWHDQAWRDPSVIADKQGRYQAFVTARVPYGPAKERGVIARATSTDLVVWQVHDPVVGPGQFGHLEIPQAIRIRHQWHLLFSVPAEVVAGHLPAVTATLQLVANHPAGPYESPADRTVIAHPEWFGAKLVPFRDEYRCLAWKGYGPDGAFAGELGDPWEVDVHQDGGVAVAGPPDPPA